MPLLIDGHNLIGKLAGLHLDDPDDEAKLVSLLRTYCARENKRATVVFDHGLPGGWSEALSGGGVHVIFASAGRNADGVLRERIREARDPRGLIVVSSDREVVAAAKANKVRVMQAEVFASRLSVQTKTVQEEYDVQVSQEEVEEWLQIFGCGHGK
jgi:predicted RNA-binding protein with PIN domain